MAAAATVHGHVDISVQSVYGILDEEGKKAEQQALRFTRTALGHAAPVGSGRHRWGNIHLSRAFGFSVRRSPLGYTGQITRAAGAWYGRVVERGRVAGVSRNGRHYPGARANPFVERTMDEIASEAEVILAGGADRAAERIGELV